MTVAVVTGFAVSFAVYLSAFITSTTHRMSGYHAYDFFMGARKFFVSDDVLLLYCVLFLLLKMMTMRGGCEQRNSSSDVIRLAPSLSLPPNCPSIASFIALNPRIWNLDLKMWAEIRVPWIILFYVSLSAAVKCYETQGTVPPAVAFMLCE